MKEYQRTGQNTNQNALEAAQDYFRRGWSPLPIPFREKNPKLAKWQDFKVNNENELTQHFNGKPQNIGVLLGNKSKGLVDIDLDSPEAVKLADYFLPPTNAVFGRASKQKSHRLYYADFPKTEKFESGGTIVEIRSTGGQTVFPSSTHKDSGENIEWFSDGEPLRIEADKLRLEVVRLACACVLIKFWGNHIRNDLTMALSGGLLRNGFSEAETLNFIKAVCAGANDEETATRLKTVQVTADKLKRGEAVTGFPKLAELTDKKAVNKILQWLNIPKSRNDNQPSAMKNPGASDAENNNAEPIPLPDEKFTVPELDAKLLPSAWREWLADIAERLQCPVDYAAISAIVTAGAIIGNKIKIKPKTFDSWLVTPNLYGAIVGVSGAMKSPAVSEGVFFFREIAEKERIEFEKEQAESNFENEYKEAKRAELKGKMKAKDADKEKLRAEYDTLKAEEITEKRLWTSDPTVEKLGEILNQNPNGVLILRDELTGWLRSLERSGREQDRAFYLEAWNGHGTFSFDRIGRGTVYIKNMTVSILGTIQPAMIAPYLRNSLDGFGDDGLIQRLQMLVYPEPPKNYKYIDREPKGRKAARKSFNGLYELQPDKTNAKQLTAEDGGDYFLNFNEEAQEFFKDWLTELENDLRSNAFASNALESHFSKYRSLMPSLALIFHLLDKVSEKKDEKDIELENAKLAAAWCSYLQKHAEKLYVSASNSEFESAKEILKRIKKKEIENGFTEREVYRKHWSKLATPEQVKKAIDILCNYGYLFPRKIETTGRTQISYIIHRSFL